jgi:hypothetical protein
LLDLFGAGQQSAISTGPKTYAPSLDRSDAALKELLACTHEVTVLDTLSATADLSLVERWKLVERCRPALSVAARNTGKQDMAGSCPVVLFGTNGVILLAFSEFDNNLKAVDAALAAVPGASAIQIGWPPPHLIAYNGKIIIDNRASFTSPVKLSDGMWCLHHREQGVGISRTIERRRLATRPFHWGTCWRDNR